MRVGLFGGSFNPVHLQHLNIAEAVRAKASLDEVWIVPVFKAVHKQGSDLLPFKRRFELVEAAVAGREGLFCSDIEKRLDGPSYTIRLVRHVKREFPSHEFFLILGSDSLRDLPTWKDAGELAKEIPFIVVGRPGVENAGKLPNAESRWVAMAANPASSSSIRSALRSGRFKGLPVPAAAMARIVAGDLYDCLGHDFRLWLKEVTAREANLPKGMQAHLAGVALLTAEFAAALSEDPRRGYLAGISHDIFRLSGKSEVERWASQGGRELNLHEKQEHMLAHGLAAAGFLRSLRPKVPDAIVAAVRSHTFPRIGLAALTRALIMGDALDPGRGKPELDALRNSGVSLDEKYLQVVIRKRKRALAKQNLPLRNCSHD